MNSAKMRLTEMNEGLGVLPAPLLDGWENLWKTNLELVNTNQLKKLVRKKEFKQIGLVTTKKRLMIVH